MLKIKNMNLNNVIRQGDTKPRQYQLDTGNLDLNLTNKSATIRLMTANFQGVGYETTATVSSENKISFSIDDVIPAREYRLEITVDDYVFPSRALDGQFNVDPSSHGQEVNIIQIIGKDEIVRDVKARVENELEPFLGEIEQAELDRQAQEEAREATNKSARDYLSEFPIVKSKSEEAITKANQADALSKSVQSQFNQVVIDGDSSVEAAQARVDASGHTNATLKERLDKEHNEVTAQLAQKADKDKARLKSVPITELDISDTLRQQMSGNAPVLQTIPDNFISTRKSNFIQSANLYDKDASYNGFIGSNGEVVADLDWRTSDFMQFNEGDILRSSHDIKAYSLYRTDGSFISRTINVTIRQLTIPNETYLIKVQFLNSVNNNMMISKNSQLPSMYRPYREQIDTSLIGNLEKTMFKKFDVNIDELTFTKSQNLFDKSKVVTGQYISYLSGEILTNASYAYIYIPIKGGTQYTRNNPNQHFVFYDIEGNLVANPSAPQVTSIISAPTNATVIGFSVRIENLESQMLVEGSSLPSGYIPYNRYIPKEILDPSLELYDDIVEDLINIPSKIQSLIGSRNDIYYENIMNKSDRKDIDLVFTTGAFQFEKRFGYIANAEGTIPLTIATYKDGREMASKTSELVFKSTTGNNKNFKVLFIGDSNTNAGEYTQKLLDLFSTDSGNIELVGTRGTAPNLHEGRGGWSTGVYTMLSTLSGVTNPFWNSASSAFDFSYYAGQNSINGLTHVFINLGTNDIFDFDNDNQLVSGVTAILSRFDTMINSIKSFDNNLKIGIMLPIPPSIRQDDFAAAYGTGMTRWRFKRNYDYLISEMIKYFDNRTQENIYVVASHLSLDPDGDFKGQTSTPSVHPNNVGLQKVGESVFKFLKVVG